VQKTDAGTDFIISASIFFLHRMEFYTALYYKEVKILPEPTFKVWGHRK
jgi:hypothetical protein